MSQTQYLTGRVLWFNRQRGYGMIAADNRTANVFFHHSVITGHGPNILFESDTVEYILDQYGRPDFPEASEVWRYLGGADAPRSSAAVGSVQPAPQARGGANMKPSLKSPVESTPSTPIEIPGLQATSSAESKITAEHVGGRVVSFNRLKGFGYIQPDDGGEQVYVDFSTVRDDALYVGDRVKYIAVGEGRGAQASDVFIV